MKLTRDLPACMWLLVFKAAPTVDGFNNVDAVEIDDSVGSNNSVGKVDAVGKVDPVGNADAVGIDSAVSNIEFFSMEQNVDFIKICLR